MAREASLAKLPLPARVAIGVALAIILGIAYFVVLYGDLASSIKAAESRERTLREDLSEARKAEFAYQRDLAELTERQHRQRELNKVLPVTSETPAFLSALQTVANVAGVSLAAWNPMPEQTEEFYARIPMRLELVGRYHQVAKFFYGVGQLERIINIENISIQQPKVNGEDVNVQVQALATAFRALQEESGAKKTDKRAKAKKGAGK